MLRQTNEAAMPRTAANRATMGMPAWHAMLIAVLLGTLTLEPVMTDAASPPAQGGPAADKSADEGSGSSDTQPDAGPALEAFLDRVELGRNPRRPDARVKLHTRDAHGRIVGLRLRGVQLQPVDFSVIGTLRNLESLDLEDSNVADEDLSHLAGLADLREVELADTQIGGAALKHLAALPRLERLGLRRTGVTDDDLRHLQGMARLRHLSLYGTKVTDAGAKHLGQIASLEVLRLGHTGVADAALRELRPLKDLFGLTLDGTQVTQAGLDYLAESPRFAWIASAEATAEELVRRMERGDQQGILDMWTVGLFMPQRGRMQRLKLEPIPPTEKDAQRHWRRFQVEMHWTVEAEKLDDTFFATFAVDRGAVFILETGIRENDRRGQR